MSAGRAIVIGYGNPLRADDGAAGEVIEGLSRLQPHAAEWRLNMQLLPEMADDLQKYDRAIFVDCSVEFPPGIVNCKAVERRAETDTTFTHHLDPATLLGLTHTLFAKSPEGFLVSIGGEDFAAREGVSPQVKASLSEAKQMVLDILAKGEVACTSTR